MEEKKKKKQEEKSKKEAAQKKVAEQKTKVPDSAKPSPSVHPASPSLTLSLSAASSSGNGKRAPSSAQQQQQQQPTPGPRYPPREVPPRFRQQEHKQLLKRGQPLPAGTLPLATSSSSSSASSSSASTQLGTSSPPQTPSSKRHTELSHPSGLGAHYEKPHWGLSSNNNSSSSNGSSSTGWAQVIIDENDSEAWPSISVGNSHAAPECPADAERSADVRSSSSMSMATGAGQPAHYPISKSSANHSASMVSSQGGPNRGWGPEGKADGLAMGGRGQPNWSSPNLNLNPNANPAAWPMLGHEGPNMGGGGGMGGSNSLPPNMCGAGGASNGNGNMGNANGNLMGDNTGTGAWGNPDASEQHQSPAVNVSFSMEPPNLNTDGPNHTNKPEPMSPVHGWGGQSPTESSQTNGDGTAIWGGSGGGDSKTSEPKDPGWDSGSVSWGRGGGSGNGGGSGGTGRWGDWEKQSSGEASGWDSADVPQQEPMNSWNSEAPASEGSGDSSEGRSRHRERSSSSGSIPLLPRQDLDPRVLSNTGWGQTPVRQHTVWEMEEVCPDRKSESGTEGWGSSSGATPAGPPPMPAGGANPNLGGAPRPDSGGKNEPAGPVGSASGWGGAPPPPKQSVTGWGEPPASKKVSNGSVSGWGDPVPSGPPNGPKSSQSWGSEEKSPSWDDGPAQSKQQGWGEPPKQSQGWGNGSGGSSSSGGEWGDTSEVKKNGTGNPMWEGEGNNWKESPRNGSGGGGGGGGGGWGKPAPSMGGNWGDAPPRANGPGPGQGWGGKPQEGPGGGNNGAPTMGSWGGPNSVKQSSGWGSGGRSDSEATGWEEPSPPSIRRKMEIDDGTSTWGDPSAYSKSVNMWDRNNPVAQGNSGPGNNSSGGNNNHSAPNNNNHHHHHHNPHHNQAPMQNHSNGSNNNGSPNQPGPPQNRPPLVTPGWGDLPNVQAKPEPSSWGEPAPNAPSVDNGTSAWGKPPRGCGGWGDGGHESAGPYGRGNVPPGSGPKQGPKSMQDSWGSGGEDMGMSTGQWEADDGDMWNSPTSQESSSSCNSWGNPPKKVPPKGKMPNKQDDTWIMNRLIKQLTDMGFPRDPAEEALKSNNMNLDQAMSALLEKKTELDKRGMGMSDYNGLNKPMGCRPPALSKDSSSDRAPFLDKDGGLSDDTPTSPFMPSPGLKLPLANSSLPGHGLVGVSSGLAMQNLNNRQMQNGMFGSGGAAQARALQPQPPQAPPPQPSVPPLSSSQPALRTQVPQFLSPQVQAQLLQFAAKNIGLNPALLTSPINPQQMTLLYQLQQLQMAYQRLQIQQQMMQAQRSVSGPIRQQEQQVARTINNMQQQIQQHQRQLAQALLMKQQPPPPPHSGLHPAAGKSALDSFPGHPQASGLNDLQTKEPQSSPNSYSPYPLSGLNPSMNVNCMEVGGLSMKDPPQPQSRLSQWTHPNSMDSLPGNGSHMEPSLNKHGGIPPAPNHGPTGKTPMDDSYSPYGLMSSSDSPTSPLVPPESWAQGKSPTEKISNGTNISWPPEFCPGVPWKGLQNIDPENDPNMTPGSVPSGPTINTNIQDVHRYLQRDRSGGKLLDMKSTWSPGPISHTQASLSHELWKVPPGARNTTAPSRPPPGLTNTKPSSTWGGHSLGLAPGWNSSSYSEGTTWSTDSSNRTSSWLVLRNLTPQIDGSTLRTLCMQHGPLITFHLNLTQGNAVVRYSSKEEAAKAQKSLHMCVLGNTTILAEFAGEEEVNRFFAQGQSLTPTTSWQANPGTNQTRLGGAAAAAAAHTVSHWSGGNSSGGVGVGGAGKAPGSSAGGSAGGGGGGAGDLLWGGVQQYSSLWGPPGGDDARVIGSPIPINTLLPGDLLSGESM